MSLKSRFSASDNQLSQSRVIYNIMPSSPRSLGNIPPLPLEPVYWQKSAMWLRTRTFPMERRAYAQMHTLMLWKTLTPSISTREECTLWFGFDEAKQGSILFRAAFHIAWVSSSSFFLLLPMIAFDAVPNLRLFAYVYNSVFTENPIYFEKGSRAICGCAAPWQ